MTIGQTVNARFSVRTETAGGPVVENFQLCEVVM